MCVVDDWVILGGFTVVHQFVRVGAHAMTAMCSLLFADLPPFVMCQGQPAQARSMNFEGLRRRGFSPERIAAVKSHAQGAVPRRPQARAIGGAHSRI